VCEAFGWEAGLDRSPREAPVFVGLCTAMIAASALVILIPGVPLIPVMLLSQVLNGMLLPVVLVFLILLSGDREVMGRVRNSRLFAAAAWIVVAALTALGLLLVVITLLGM
jgi:Mn2+/Fe2+ NRAMP family transporter